MMKVWHVFCWRITTIKPNSRHELKFGSLVIREKKKKEKKKKKNLNRSKNKILEL